MERGKKKKKKKKKENNNNDDKSINTTNVYKTSDAQCNCSPPAERCPERKKIISKLHMAL